ncbi:MAG TPA: hypothetical protein VGR45_00705 [Stellaceae bacterium]|nr:hypothetical protein [Stellaceae bacterium]
MEGGSPELIWERWTLPMYYAQRRYWHDHPRLEQIAAAYFKLPKQKTPPPNPDGTTPKRVVDWSLLDNDHPLFRPRKNTVQILSSESFRAQALGASNR